MSDGAAPILLVSMPQMMDPNFARTVVLLCDYSEEGAFGLVVNRPMSEPAWQMVKRAVERGVMLFAPVGLGGAAVKINPPLVIGEEALAEGLGVLEQIAAEIAAGK